MTAGERDWQQRLRQDAVRPSAPERDRIGVGDERQDVDVGQVRRDHQRRVAVTGPPLEPGLAERRPHQRVAEVIQDAAGRARPRRR